MTISNDCDALLCLLYREYRTRRSYGVPRSKAAYFCDDESIRQNFMPLWCVDDVADVCWQLVRYGLLSALPGDDKANCVTLTDQGIVYMENRFGSQLGKVFDRLVQLSALLPPWVG